MKTNLEKAKEFIYEAVEYNINENGSKAIYNEKFNLSDLILPSGFSVEDMLSDLYIDGKWENDLDLSELIDYQKNCYFAILTQLHEKKLTNEYKTNHRKTSRLQNR